MYDAVFVLGGRKAYHFFEHLTNELKIRALFIPVSIYNDITESKQSLGYDSALNAVVEDIYKIEDTISSCRHDQFRLFGVQVPGVDGSNLAKDLAITIGDLICYWEVDSTEDLFGVINDKIRSEKNHSFLIFDDRVDLKTVENHLLANLNEISWSFTKVDEAQCMGKSPTAIDRLLAKHIAFEAINWSKSNEGSGRLLLQDNKAFFQASIASVV
ncbi:6-phosphofructokinase [Halalkalibacter krulwichiae]|uniref:6-phosphofructokinase n=1 Tax=Halalkalibacter krulwichiae TaxID=199441 RepID=A0A1X9MCT4_9BACI|nr:6-phosphofructokinase [Halalkalibacter krulwichiae]ARK31249.1 6-phosphofructokinase [Halalkalibacter krulwichiae]